MVYKKPLLADSDFVTFFSFFFFQNHFYRDFLSDLFEIVRHQPLHVLQSIAYNDSNNRIRPDMGEWAVYSLTSLVSKKYMKKIQRQDLGLHCTTVLSSSH